MQLVHTIMHNIWKVPWPLMRTFCEINIFHDGRPKTTIHRGMEIRPLQSNKLSQNNVINLFLYVYGDRESISANIIAVNNCLFDVTLQLPHNWQTFYRNIWHHLLLWLRKRYEQVEFLSTVYTYYGAQHIKSPLTSQAYFLWNRHISRWTSQKPSLLWNGIIPLHSNKSS